MDLAQLAEESAQRLGERMTLDFEGERVTNTQILDSARRLQRGFEGLGLGRGKIAVLFMINHPSVYPVFQGIFRTGGTAVPVMYQLTAPELRYILEDTRAEGIVTDTTVHFKMKEAIAGLDFIKWVVVRGGKDNPSANPPEFALETLLAGDPKTSLPNIDADDDVAMMLYTSGTTGKPKGVMLTHTNLLASAKASAAASELDRWQGPRISLSAMPMAHIFGVGVMNGGYLVPERLADSFTVQMQWFHPEKFMQTLVQHKCTSMAAVPTMLSLILSHPKVGEYDLSSLEEVICGAAPLSPELAQAFMKRYNCRVREIYGMTENAGIGSANRASMPYKPGSAGLAYPENEVRIVDDNDNPVPTGTRGEVVTRGPATMKGYFNRPKETAEALRGGWLHTGDIGYLDEHGCLFIVDRKKDMIIRGGENIYPAELEDALYAHPGVAEAAIVGVPNATYGEDVIAFVVKKPNAEITEADIMKHMAERVTKFKIPSAVHFLDALPKAGVGKILRRVLRDEAAKRAEA